MYRINLLKWLALSKSSDNKIKITEYTRSKWTYHAKGLFLASLDSRGKGLLTDPGGVSEYINIIGSSNFGGRSFNRDIETQFYIFSNESELMDKFEKERVGLYEYANHIDNKEQILGDKECSINCFTRCVYSVLKKTL